MNNLSKLCGAFLVIALEIVNQGYAGGADQDNREIQGAVDELSSGLTLQPPQHNIDHQEADEQDFKENSQLDDLSNLYFLTYLDYHTQMNTYCNIMLKNQQNIEMINMELSSFQKSFTITNYLNKQTKRQLFMNQVKSQLLEIAKEFACLTHQSKNMDEEAIQKMIADAYLEKRKETRDVFDDCFPLPEELKNDVAILSKEAVSKHEEVVSTFLDNYDKLIDASKQHLLDSLKLQKSLFALSKKISQNPSDLGEDNFGSDAKKAIDFKMPPLPKESITLRDLLSKEMVNFQKITSCIAEEMGRELIEQAMSNYIASHKEIQKVLSPMCGRYEIIPILIDHRDNWLNTLQDNLREYL